MNFALQAFLVGSRNQSAKVMVIGKWLELRLVRGYHATPFIRIIGV